jgi:multiple sugar transport system substrate-binding protein
MNEPTSSGVPHRVRRHRRPMAAGAAVGAAALLFAACGSSSSSAGNSGGTSPTTASSSGTIAKSNNAASSGGSGVTDITWWNMWSGEPATLTKEMVAQFNSEQSKIRVTVLNVPSADGDAKLLSAIAAGDPPDVFTEWNPTIGQDAQSGAILPMDQYATGKYAGIEKWMYPVVLDGGLYKSKLYAIPMSMNSQALYYNKSIMKAADISSPPKTIAQLDADQAKEWKISGSRLEQIGFYPLPTTAGAGTLQTYGVYFGVKGLGYSNGTYDLSSQAGAIAEANWMASYAKYPYSSVSALNAAYGNVAGGAEDPFAMGKQGFTLNGIWEAATNIPASDPAMETNFGIEPFPSATGGTSNTGSYINGNYNIIPKGSKYPAQAFQFIAWLAGFDNAAQTKYYPAGGWMPPSPQLAASPDFQAWEKKVPYVKTFVGLLLDKSSQAVPLTPAEAEYFTAAGTAGQSLATGKTSAAGMLSYIDSQANAGLVKSK